MARESTIIRQGPKAIFNFTPEGALWPRVGFAEDISKKRCVVGSGATQEQLKMAEMN